MEFKRLFHTVKNRDNVEYIERNAPFKSTDNTWLGDGYYFWDTFIDLAHWWGRVHCGGNYIICSTSCVVKKDIVLDLYGNLGHIEDFKEYKNELQKIYMGPITVPFILNHMSKYLESFNYKIIRAKAEDCLKKDGYLLSQRVPFINSNRSYLNLNPEIQVCFWDKKILKGCNIEIIYPDELRSDFTI